VVEAVGETVLEAMVEARTKEKKVWAINQMKARLEI
jgi:hypothetical protein